MPKSHEEAGYNRTPEYMAWDSMKARCYNPKHRAYSLYGGRGIRVCQEWLDSYSAFLSAVGRRPSPQHSLDRFPNKDGNYEAGNVRWATRTEQNNNTRKNKFITIGDETLCKSAWARRYGISRGLLQKRLDANWPVMKALTTPSRAKSAV